MIPRTRSFRHSLTAFTVFATSISLSWDPALQLSGGPGFRLAPPAFADDDDGGRDDDGGGRSAGSSSGSRGGGRDRGGYDGGGRPAGASSLRIDRMLGRWLRVYRPAKRVARRPAVRRAAVARTPAPREVVGLDISQAQIAALQTAGLVVLERDDLDSFGANITRFQVPRRLTLEEARAEIVALAPGATVDDNDSYGPQQGLSKTCLSRECLARNLIAWQLPASSAPACLGNVKLGMIDTGINPDHAALREARLEVVRLANPKQRASGLQHGTAVAALFVGAGDSRSPGLLPGASVVAVDTFTSRGGEDASDVYTLVRGLDYLVSRKVDVINLSLAGPDNKVLERSVARASEADVLLVAAAGNEGPRAGPVFPAAYPSVLAVTAVDRNKKPYRRAGQGEHIDIAAPGVDVWTAASISGARLKTGTSFAAPFVSAAAAAWRAGLPDAKAAEAMEALTRAAEDLGNPGKDHVFGWGLIRPRDLCTGGSN